MLPVHEHSGQLKVEAGSILGKRKLQERPRTQAAWVSPSRTRAITHLGPSQEWQELGLGLRKMPGLQWRQSGEKRLSALCSLCRRCHELRALRAVPSFLCSAGLWQAHGPSRAPAGQPGHILLPRRPPREALLTTCCPCLGWLLWGLTALCDWPQFCPPPVLSWWFQLAGLPSSAPSPPNP